MEPTRPWMVIAAEMEKERDPARILVLAEELNRALAEQQGQNRAAKPTAAPTDSIPHRGEATGPDSE